jgi:hypothetical protein
MYSLDEDEDSEDDDDEDWDFTTFTPIGESSESV